MFFLFLYYISLAEKIVFLCIARLASEPAREIRASLKTTHNEISEIVDRRVRVRWNTLRACRIAKIMCKETEGKHSSFIRRWFQKDCRTVVVKSQAQLTGNICEPYGQR